LHRVRLPGINTFTATTAGWGFFFCTDKSVRTGRGGEYIALTLSDASGTVVGRVFDNVDRLRDEFEAGEFVKVQGRANLFNGRLQFIVEQIRRAMPAADSQDRRDGFDEAALIPSAARPIDEMWAELQQVISEVGHPAIRALLQQMTVTHEARMRIWPAGRAVHHAYRGGFLEHVLTMSVVGRQLALIYGANADLVVAGAVLHDMGKLQELHYDTATTYTRDGNLVGHVTLGALLVHDATRAVPDFPEALRTEITHLVVSHHGAKEFGAPVEPMTAEAFILAAVDELDATLNQVRRAVSQDDSGSEFTQYHSRLGRVLWKGPSR
jgi:3'-5' exoribonuclease